MAKTVRFVMPSNAYLTPPPIEDVLRFGPPKDKDGKQTVMPYPCRILVDRPRPDGFTGGLGRLVLYRLALLFIPDPTLGRRSVQEFLRLYAEAVAGPTLSFATEAVLPGLGMIPRSVLETWLEERLFPEKGRRALEESYQKQGVWFIPLTHCMEIEGEKDFLRGDKGLRLTLAGPAGGRSSLTVRGLNSIDMAERMLIFRRLWEQTQMFWVAVRKLFWEPMIKESAALNMTLAQAQSQIQVLMDRTPLAENLPRICATELELLAPLLPAYRALPSYEEWIRNLEACARGDVNRWAIMTP